MAARVDLTARLVMESRGLAPSVRGVGFHSDWSRLYQAEAYYLDLMCKPKDKKASLLGQLLNEDGVPLAGEVELLQDDQSISNASLGRDADFFMEIEDAGHFELKITLSNSTIIIGDLAVS
jgi:hypothetical protein